MYDVGSVNANKIDLDFMTVKYWMFSKTFHVCVVIIVAL